MKEINKIYLLSPEEAKEISDYATGLILVTKDAELYYQCSTDVIVPFEKAEYLKASKILDLTSPLLNSEK